MHLPKWLLSLWLFASVALAAWTALLATGRNPLPFPDPGSRIFAASSPRAKAAVVELLGQHGLRERVRVDTKGVQRSILFDGTIVNWSSPAVAGKLAGATSAIGLVADDAAASAEAAAVFLRARGFRAEVVPDVEPGLPIVFVLTDALPGTVLNFRPHVIHMPRPAPAP